MPPIWFYFVIAAEFLWFLIETKWLTIRLDGSAGRKEKPLQTQAPCPVPAQAPAPAQAAAPNPPPAQTETQTKA